MQMSLVVAGAVVVSESHNEYRGEAFQLFLVTNAYTLRNMPWEEQRKVPLLLGVVVVA